VKNMKVKLIAYLSRFVGVFVVFVIKLLDYILRALGSNEISHMLYASFRTKLEVVNIDGLGETIFFTPSKLLTWRVQTWLSKEPETIDWIDSFKSTDDAVFWDIGANIGLYSLYAAKKHPRLKVFSFEPSTSNLPVLSKNIALNNLYDRVSICPFALTSEAYGFKKMVESSFEEGGALNSFGVSYGFDGKEILSATTYTTSGFSIDYLVSSNIVPPPTYVKIDVDGIEHLIIEGGINTFRGSTLRGICIELNGDFNEQLDYVNDTLLGLGYEFMYRLRSDYFDKTDYANVYNYFYVNKQVE
jgi:FkbM family methyltransferase